MLPYTPSPNKILPTPFLASFRPNPSNQDRSYLRSDGLRQYDTLYEIPPKKCWAKLWSDKTMNENLRPNEAEIEFLNLSYNMFYDIYEEVFEEEFWEKETYYRFSKVKDAFSVYAELLNYEPIQWVIEEIKKKRPPMEGEIGSDVFKFIRNLLLHFPFFNSWDEVWIKKSIINWDRKGLSIDRFLTTYSGRKEVKYRFWEAEKKEMTYLSISFPKKYDDNSIIYLKDLLSEKEGVKFSLILMRKILDTQVVKE
ncbi:hypothetical protein [Halocella sp. SP3-1]|uniref:hypothetical protein n=1 Tax=Halocella sp. SP3-1 TaxID=2382161 RepID=UPI00336A10C6